jgi:glycosyltransferase involved in cell wall biosynthesis
MAEPLFCVPVVTVPRRIAWCITDLDAGGAERALVQIVTRLPGHGWMPQVICLSGPGELVAPLEQAGIPVTCLGARSGRSLGSVPRLTRALRQGRPELLQSFMFHANLASRWSGWRMGLPVVCGLRVAERDAPWRMRLDRLTSRLVAHYVAVSQGVADFAVRECGLPQRQVSVIPNGVDFEKFADASPADLSPWGIPADARVVLFVGRLHPQKGPDLLLRAAVPALLQEPRLRLVLAGDGPMRSELETAAHTSGVSAQVHLIGRQQDVAGLLKASAVCVVPSRWEGMPNVVLEAMAAGRPVIVSDAEGCVELVEEGVTGRIFSRDNCEELRAALDAVLRDPARGAKLASAAQGIVSQRFTWDSVAAQYAGIYARLTAPQGVNVDKSVPPAIGKKS